jgi:hypothetical protein
VDTGFVAGSFISALVSCFTANPFMAVVRKGAVRPINNLSSLKEQCHEIFSFRFFSQDNSIWGSDKPPKIFSNSVSNLPSFSNFKFDSPLYNIPGSNIGLGY